MAILALDMSLNMLSELPYQSGVLPAISMCGVPVTGLLAEAAATTGSKSDEFWLPATGSSTLII